MPLRPTSSRPYSCVRCIVCAVALLLTAGCGDDAGPTDPTPRPVNSVRITPGADTLTALGDTVRLSATAIDADGTVVPGVALSWSSDDPSVVTVTPDGLASAVGNGIAEIVASADEVSGSAELAVIQVATSVEVSPATATLSSAGATQQFTATARDANGAVVDAPVVWSSENHAVATVDADGLVTSRGTGAIAITAAVQGVPGHATLTVSQAVESMEFSAQPSDVRAGAAFDPAVQLVLLDANGFRVTDAADPVTLAIGTNPAAGILGGARTVNAVGGVATFPNVWLDRAATGYTLVASVPGAAVGVTSTAFAVTAGGPSKLAFVTQPSATTAGDSIGPAVEVRVEDAWGNPIGDGVTTVSMALASDPGGATLQGTTSAITSGGLAAFDDLWLDRAASGYTLAAAAPGLDAGVSDPFDVMPAPAARLAFLGDIPAMEASAPTAEPIQVGVRDRFGNAVAGAADVRLFLAASANGGVLGGDVFVTTSGGVASFSGVSVDRPGVVTLGATADGLAPAESDGFRVALTADTIAAGTEHTCAISAYATFCWGHNPDGRLGTGDLGDRYAPTPVLALVNQDWGLVAPGRDHTCAARTSTGSAECWGENGRFQLGDGTTEDAVVPTGVSAPSDLARLDAGTEVSCAISAGSAWCWGSGPVGDGTTSADRARAVSDPPSGPVTWTGISVGDGHACGVTAAGDAFCWGSNFNGELGDSTTTDTTTPVAVRDPASGPVTWSAIGAGSAHTCALTAAGDAYCWGGNFYGALGDGTTTASLVPVPVSDPAVGAVAWAQIGTGQAHTCGLTTAGDIYCWGSNYSGAVGIGTQLTSSVPVPIARSEAWRNLAVGYNHTCAVTDSGRSFCWGTNNGGQIGDGTTVRRNVPTPIVQ